MEQGMMGRGKWTMDLVGRMACYVRRINRGQPAHLSVDVADG